jgi:Zn-dependent metalloprotease
MRRLVTVLMLGAALLGFVYPAHAMRFSPKPNNPGADSSVTGTAFSKNNQRTSPTNAQLTDVAHRLRNLVGAHPAGTTAASGVSALKAALADPARRLFDPRQIGRSTAFSRIPPGWDLRRNETNGTPVFLTVPDSAMGLRKPAKSGTASEIALEFIFCHRDLFLLDNPQDELLPGAIIHDNFGRTHVEFTQQFHGIPFWAHNLVAHLESDGRLYALNARYSPTPQDINLSAARISAEDAVQQALTDLAQITEIRDLDSLAGALLHYDQPTAKLYIWAERTTGQPHLAWHVEIRPNLRDWWYYFIDAHTGEVLEAYNNTKFDGPTVGTGPDLQGIVRSVPCYIIETTFYLIDASRSIWQSYQPDVYYDPRGAILTLDLRDHDQGYVLYHVVSGTTIWTDPVAVSAHYNTGLAFEYYRQTHGRQSIDGNGGTIKSVIHMTDDGLGYDNAFWNGWGIWYGDGYSKFSPLAEALDVVAHEMGHGVTEYTVNLEYMAQSGALNESYSDVWGAMADRDDWQIGEDIVNPSIYLSGAMRDMSDPHNGGSGPSTRGWQPAQMSEYQNLPNTSAGDNGGVHVNSGIPNYVAYLVGEAIGKDKMEQIWYRILSSKYLNRQANFCDMRSAAILSVTDLYGDPSTELDAVTSAFDAVGISENCGGQEPPDDPTGVPTGDEWIALINDDAGDHSMYLARPVIESGADIVLLTSTQVNAGSGKAIDVTYFNAKPVILFVDEDYHLRYIQPDGTGEAVIDSTTEWWSIAVDHNFSKVALSTLANDSMIHIIDMVTPGNSKSIRLYSPTTQQGVNSYSTEYADVMDWDDAGQYLLYDASNRIPQDSGEFRRFWETNILDVESEVIMRLFPPQPEGINYGDPSFAQTNTVVFTLDYFDENECVDDIMAANLYTYELGLLEHNYCDPDDYPNLGFPRFSPDDNRVVMQWIDHDGMSTLWQKPVDISTLAATGDAEYYMFEAQRPFWFASDFSVDILDDGAGQTLPADFALHQNYPNPFNTATMIEYETSAAGPVTLQIYNILGQRVFEQEMETQAPGIHTFRWNGIDQAGKEIPGGIYFYRVSAAGTSQSRKMVLLK